MRTKFYVLGALTLLFAACQDELQESVNQALGADTTPLSINVLANPTTKALVEGNTLPISSKIGVKLVAADGTDYDGKTTYNNIFYSTSDGNTWSVDAEHKILLSATEGKAYAYYPYTGNASLDFTAIPIESAANPDNQVDYMFGNEATGLKNSNPTANFTMSHAMSIVNFTVAKGTYTGSGTITSVTMKGNTASNTGTMNAVAGSVTASNPGYEFTSTNSLTLGSAKGKFIVVPSGTQSALDFKVVMDGQTYTATTADVTLASGQVYKYTLTMNSTGLTVSTVSVTPWGDEQDKGSLDTDLYDPWAVAKATNGVYAIDNDGNPVDYTTASAAAKGTYKGVALVVDGKAIEIATDDASAKSKWAETDPMTDEEAAYFLSNYITSETTAKVDMDGKANTERILASNVTIASVINSYNDGSHGSTDWYLPSAGQLNNIYPYLEQIYNLMTKVSDTTISLFSFWSSSVYSASAVWLVSFDGRVCYSNVNVSFSVLLVRDL